MTDAGRPAGSGYLRRKVLWVVHPDKGNIGQESQAVEVGGI